MTRTFEIIQETNLLQSVGSSPANDGSGREIHEHTTFFVQPGDMVPEEDLSPVIIALFDADDAHVHSYMHVVDGIKSEKKPAGADEPYGDYGKHDAKQVVAKIPDLTDDQLDAVEKVDERKTVKDALAAERERREGGDD